MTWREKYRRDPDLAESIIEALRRDFEEAQQRIETLETALKSTTKTHKLLKQVDSLLEAFRRHYEAVQTADAIAQMIQRDCWTHFQIEVANARQAIRCELEKEVAK